MVPAFGSLSIRTVERDSLGRPRHRLLLRPLGPPGSEERSARFEVDELELLGRDAAADAIVEEAAAFWPPPARELLPWALVHGAVAAPVLALVHGDAVCTVANAPGGQAICERSFGGAVAWVPYARPGPALARALVALAGPTAAIVPRVGLLTWGEDPDEVVSRAAAFEHTAEGEIGRNVDRSLAPEPLVPAEVERALLSMRGRTGQPRPVVLATDLSLIGLAGRADAGEIAALASVLEIIPPWSGAPNSAIGAGSDDGAGPVRASLIPGLGLVSTGLDEPEAHERSVVWAHALRVTATLVDRFADGVGLTRAEVAQWPAGDGTPAGPALPLAGRVYLVTGAASGIGRDVARHLATLGAHLGLADIDAQGLARTADELAGSRGRPTTVAGDLTDELVIDRLVADTIRRFGGIDGAVLNVGVALPGEIRNLSVADWRRSLEVNTTSHFLLAHRLLPALEAQGLGGSLVFIGSKNMFSPGAGFGAYSASKAALAQLARVVAIEGGPFGVRSNIVNPDNVFEGSALWSPELRAQRAAVYGIKPEDLEAYYTQRNLMKVPITGMDVARAVAWLLSDEASRTTACVLTVDGGVPGVFPR